MMKNTGLYFLLAFLAVTFLSTTANAFEDPNDTVAGYLLALQQGDVKTIKDSITGDLLKKREVLLEQNESYPGFLKNIYQEAEFQLLKTKINKDNAQINIEIRFQDETRYFILFLKKDARGEWKIYKEISE
jgi:hypothetical protein